MRNLYRILYTSHYSVNAPLSPFCCCFDCCISDCVLFASLWIWSVVFGLTFPQFIFLKSWTSWSMKRTLDEVFLTSMILLICWKYWSTRGYEELTQTLIRFFVVTSQELHNTFMHNVFRKHLELVQKKKTTTKTTKNGKEYINEFDNHREILSKSCS